MTHEVPIAGNGKEEVGFWYRDLSAAWYADWEFVTHAMFKDWSEANEWVTATKAETESPEYDPWEPPEPPSWNGSGDEESNDLTEVAGNAASSSEGADVKEEPADGVEDGPHEVKEEADDVKDGPYEVNEEPRTK